MSAAQRQRVGPVLPSWLWLWFPPVLLLVILPIRVIDPALYRSFVDGELGLIELTTPAIAIIGAVVGIRLVLNLRQYLLSPLGCWTVVMTLACIYFAGEELSWGQHLVGWSTPDYIGALNDQNETNLHNMSSWFDQKPRLMLEIWVLVGGVIVAARGQRGQTTVVPARISSWVWPTVDCLPAAVLAILIRMPERLKDLFSLQSLPYELRYSEPQEYYFALFLALYLMALSARVRADLGAADG